jgi:hypothetical protein
MCGHMRHSVAPAKTLVEFLAARCSALNHIVLKFVYPPVSRGNLPHHLNDLETSLIVESLVELAAEMVDIYRDSVGCDRVLDQPDGSETIKTRIRYGLDSSGIEYCFGGQWR